MPRKMPWSFNNFISVIMKTYEVARKFYRAAMQKQRAVPIAIHSFKMQLGEIFTLHQNKKLYADVRWNGARQKDFDAYWLRHYGRKIGSKSHRYFEGLNHTYHKEYFPEFLYTAKLELALNDFSYASMFNDKSLFEILFAKNSLVNFPQTVIVKNKNIFYDSNRQIVGHEQAANLLSNCGEIVVKPILGGSEGQGILFPNFVDGLDINKESDLQSLLSQSDNFIVQKKLKQNNIYGDLHPESLNTIRITTYITREKIHHAPLCLRVGTGSTKVDNLGKGGLLLGVTDSGSVLRYGYKLGKSKDRVEKHPDSGVVFQDYNLPGTVEIISSAKKLHGLVPRIGIISWDFAIDTEDRVTLIEANFLAQSIRYPQITHEQPIFGEHTIDMINLIRTK